MRVLAKVLLQKLLWFWFFVQIQKGQKTSTEREGVGYIIIQDATIAAAYCQLAATALGLSSVWIGAFDDGEVLKVLGNPSGLVTVAVIPMGYAIKEPEAKPRRKLDDLVHEI